jgi:hypothetical protein
MGSEKHPCDWFSFSEKNEVLIGVVTIQLIDFQS